MNNLASLPENQISSYVPRKLHQRMLWLPDDSRNMGIHIMAGKGSGKSRLMGRLIAWLDFIRGVPQVIFDPHGPTIDNFLDKVVHFPQETQVKLWRRITYVDMSGQSGYVYPFPLYYRMGQESLYEVSQRYLDVVRKIDPFLQTASVEGWNALWRTGTYSGMILAALNLQISEAENLLNNVGQWHNQFNYAIEKFPDVLPAVNYLSELGEEKNRLHSRRTESFFNKIALFGLDPNMKAMFGASWPGINWDTVVGERRTVLLDFRNESDLERRRFKMVWAFNYLMDYVKHRGAGRHRPIGLIIDELTSLFSLQSLAGDLFGSELDELINVLARNYSIWLTIAHQENFQLTEQIMKSLMTMGTQILGVTTDPDAAMRMAQIYYKYDPYWVKKYIPIYMSFGGGIELIDYNTEEFKIDEQIAIYSRKFMSQSRFQFLVKPSLGEGTIIGNLRPVSIERFDKGIYPDQSALSETRDWLTTKNGISINQILEEIAKRTEDINSIKQLPIPGRKATASKQTDISFWD